MMAKAIKQISRILMLISGVCLVMMMFHVTIDVALKFFFNRPIEGTIETVSYYYMVSIVFLPLAMVELRNEHIFVDLFVRRLPATGRRWVYIFSCLVGIVYFSGMSYQTFLDAVKATSELETIMSNYLFYVWPSRWALPVGMGVMVLALVLNMLRAIVDFADLEKQEDAS